MRVKARLTTTYLQPQQDPPPDPKSDHNLDTLSRLFTADPLVAMDEEGWYLSASRIDQADDDDANNVPGVLMAIEAGWLLSEMNGIARLLRVAYGVTVRPVLLSNKFEGKRSGARVRIGYVVAYSHQTDHLDAPSATTLIQLAETEPPVKRVLELLSRESSEWFWFDMYRVYEQVNGYFSDKKTLDAWLDSLHPGWSRKRAEFEDSANNPSHGTDRRHSSRNYVARPYRGTTEAVKPMSTEEASKFIRQLVVDWIRKEYGSCSIPSSIT